MLSISNYTNCIIKYFYETFVDVNKAQTSHKHVNLSLQAYRKYDVRTSVWFHGTLNNANLFCLINKDTVYLILYMSVIYLCVYVLANKCVLSFFCIFNSGKMNLHKAAL